MATWEVTITPIDVERKEASITATRTDGTDVRTFNIITAILATPQQKEEVLNEIWAQYQADVRKRDRIAAFVGGLEAQAKTALEAKEI